MKRWISGILIFCGIVFISIVGAAVISSSERINPIQQINLPDRIEQVLPSVVHLRADAGWQGSGFAITDTIIATARHCVKGADKFTITLNSGKKFTSDDAVYSKEYDLGFIKLDKPVLQPVKFDLISDCRLGQQVFAVGSPFGHINFNTVTLGIISGLNRNWDGINPYTGEKYGWRITFTTDAAGHPGNSGCPVFTDDGRVIGILVGGYSPVLNGCMPVDLFYSDIQNIELLFALEKYQVEGEKEESVNLYMESVEK